MKFNASAIIWTLLWSLFMGVTALSIGFGALFPSMNLISKPFVCPRGEMSEDEKVYNPYPGKTITTITWYCTDSQSGQKEEIGLLPMAMSAGLIYGFALFIVIFIWLWFNAQRSASGLSNTYYGTKGLSALEKQERDSIHDAQYSSHENFAEPPGKSKDTKARLNELQDLRAANMVSESEYEKKRAEILKNL